MEDGRENMQIDDGVVKLRIFDDGEVKKELIKCKIRRFKQRYHIKVWITL